MVGPRLGLLAARAACRAGAPLGGGWALRVVGRPAFAAVLAQPCRAYWRGEEEDAKEAEEEEKKRLRLEAEGVFNQRERQREREGSRPVGRDTDTYADEHDLHEIMQGNREWAASEQLRNPEFFLNLAAGQSPRFLWIGCSDSRVPENRLLGLQPGEVFVHRNVANLVHGPDTNLLSVLTYALEALDIRHVSNHTSNLPPVSVACTLLLCNSACVCLQILVVGHYDCGGVRAAMSNKRALGGNKSSVIDNWLTGVRDVYRLHKDELDAIDDPEERHRRLVEKNVIEQCLNVYKTGVVQHHRLKTFHNKKKYNTDFAYPRVHAMVFDPADGMLQKLQVDFKESIAEYRNVYDLYDGGDAEWVDEPPLSEREKAELVAPKDRVVSTAGKRGLGTIGQLNRLGEAPSGSEKS